MSVKFTKGKQASEAGIEKPETLTGGEEETPIEDPDKDLTLYEKFIKAKKKEWLVFNAATIAISILMAIGTWFIISTHDGEDCRNLKRCLYIVMVLHGANSIETLMNLVGLERKLCSGFAACIFLLFEATMVLYMHVVYFSAMPDESEQFDGCIVVAPKLFLWMMGNILLFYVGAVVVICYFFRGFFQDPQLEEEERIKDKKSRDLYEQRQMEAKIAAEIANGQSTTPYDPSMIMGVSSSTVAGVVLDDEPKTKKKTIN